MTTKQSIQASFPFRTTVNESIKLLKPNQPFQEGEEVVVTGAMNNGEFVHVIGHHLPISMDRLNLTEEQRELVQSRKAKPKPVSTAEQSQPTYAT